MNPLERLRTVFNSRTAVIYVALAVFAAVAAAINPLIVSKSWFLGPQSPFHATSGSILW
jgi:hypothetical protein